MTLQGPHAELVLKYIEAILEGRRDAAEGIVLQALGSGLQVADLYQHVLQPAQIELGAMWHAGEISVADEHFGSATTHMIMSMLRSHFFQFLETVLELLFLQLLGHLLDFSLLAILQA